MKPLFTIHAGEYLALLTITAFSAVIYMAYGVDFPRLNARLSRLV